MKVLIAITSCVKFALDGSNQASRETWMTDLAQFSYVDCRFFVGDGTPTGEDETQFQQSLRDCPHVHLDDPRVSLADPNPYVPKPDEVVVHAPDDYIYHTWKSREIFRWAQSNDYDFVFMPAGDTYIDLPRLFASGFEAYDFVGRQHGDFGVGGSGYWLSKKTLQLLIVEPGNDWATDRWVGNTLLKYGIRIHDDRRYGASPEQTVCCAPEGRNDTFPTPTNDMITAHLAEAPGHYHHDLMYHAHRVRRG